MLTLVFTPSMLALRVWAGTYAMGLSRLLAIMSFGRGSRAARDWALNRAARKLKAPEIIWEDEAADPPLVLSPAKADPLTSPQPPLRAAE
jgi:multidrug efflux pump